MAYDAVAAPRKAPGEIFDTYLGMLYPTEDFKVYGYISNTRIKFILVVDDMLQKEEEMRMVRLWFCATLQSCHEYSVDGCQPSATLAMLSDSRFAARHH